MSAPLPLGPRTGPTLDSFFNPVMEARGGIRLAVLYSDAHPVHVAASIQTMTDEGRTDLIPGVQAYYDYIAASLSGPFHLERDKWAQAVRLLVPPEVVALMTDAWRRQLAGSLAYYYPPHI